MPSISQQSSASGTRTLGKRSCWFPEGPPSQRTASRRASASAVLSCSSPADATEGLRGVKFQQTSHCDPLILNPRTPFAQTAPTPSRSSLSLPPCPPRTPVSSPSSMWTARSPQRERCVRTCDEKPADTSEAEHTKKCSCFFSSLLCCRALGCCLSLLSLLKNERLWTPRRSRAFRYSACPLFCGNLHLSQADHLFLFLRTVRSRHFSHPLRRRTQQQEVLPDMVEFIAKLRQEITVGVVGGSDLPKQKEQLGESGEFHLRWRPQQKKYRSLRARCQTRKF